MDILQQDRRESAEQRQELCDIITRLQGELQSTEEQRDKVSGVYFLAVTIALNSLSESSAFNERRMFCSWSRSASSCS